MHLFLVTPALPSSLLGNGVTASRWQKLFAGLGHRVTVAKRWQREPCDVMIALHARRSHGAVTAFRQAHRERPLVVVLTGTDLYRDLPGDPAARHSLDLADRLVGLQERVPAALPPSVLAKTRIIEQSAVASPRRPARSDAFDVCILSHLRPVKDCLRTAKASRRLPATSKIRVLHAGAVLDGRTGRAVRREQRTNPRYRWLGPLDVLAARSLLLESRLLAATSKLEGGANSVCEALASGVPVVASAVDGNIGLLGADYRGLFPLGDTAALARLLARAEAEPAFYRHLESQVDARRYLVEPDRERRLWSELLAELSDPTPGS